MEPSFAAASCPAAPNALPWRVRTSSHTHDLDQHARLLTAWEQSYDQLSAGSFAGALNEAWLGDIQIFEERLSQAVFQRGAGRANTLAPALSPSRFSNSACLSFRSKSQGHTSPARR